MLFRACVSFALLFCTPLGAQTLQETLSLHQSAVERASRKTIDPVIADLIESGLPQVTVFLEKWQNKDVWMRKEDKLFFFAEPQADKTYVLTDIDTGDIVGETEKKALKQLKPNSGVRSVIAVALVQFQLSDPDPERRAAALQAIERDPEVSQLVPLLQSLETETDPELRQRKETLARLLTARFGDTTHDRVTAIKALSQSLSVETRAALNPILATRLVAASNVTEGANIARRYLPTDEGYPVDQAQNLLVGAGVMPLPVTFASLRDALADHITDGTIAGMPVSALNTDAARRAAYDILADQGLVPVFTPPLSSRDWSSVANLDAYAVVEVFDEPDTAVTTAAKETLATIEARVGVYQTFDLLLDGISLASIYFLAAIGLAITFGVMRVINMAHGEFIMLGAYTGYVVQLFITDYTWSLVVALPLAFAVTFAAGVAMERLVIRHLYKRPLETLLATFGISIALQQLAKNIFGTQARPLTSPAWLDGAWAMNDVVSISYIRIAIFVLGVIFLLLLLFILNRTRLGLEVRAVTQNPKMAASMGINPARINMLTFGLGSGIAGIAGVAIGLYAKVTSELGSDYIVQSFMTVVVGGVGNIWGTLLGATMIGNLQKLIEWFNPSNTLAAQTYMILFIILFIQFRPRGIIALKGRAAGD